MRYLLDTDHISVLQQAHGVEFMTLAARIARVDRSELALSIISLHEQSIGCHSAINQARRPSAVVDGYRLFDRILRVYSIAPVLPFDDQASALVEDFRSQGVRRVGIMDLRIASIALSRNLVLLTRNGRDFDRIPQLSIEGWTR